MKLTEGLALPAGEWYLLTCFDTILYYDADTGELAHDDVDCSPRNFTLVQSAQGASARIATTASGAEKVLREIYVGNVGNERRVALYLRGLLATACPDGSIGLGAQRLMDWEVLRLVREDHLNSKRYWTPLSPQGGTELMMNQLSDALGGDADRINLQLNSPQGVSIHHRLPAEDNPLPRVVWIHNDHENPQYEWLRDEDEVARVARLVFVSQGQRQNFLDKYDLPAERCVVIRNAINTHTTIRPWPQNTQWRWRCAYISAAFRGLDLLLEAWQDMAPENAELHIWSGRALWAIKDNFYRPLFAKANSIPNVFYHRVAPNDFIRKALLDMHFLLYPCKIPVVETFCLSMVEAMSAGCRVIAPSASVFTETAAGFARLYPYSPDPAEHKRAFIHAAKDEFAYPWSGRPELAEAQQAYCQVEYDWSGRAREWRFLIDDVLREQA